MGKTFFVYTLIDPRTDTVFYVGKGTGNRVEQHRYEVRDGCRCKKCNKMRKLWQEGETIYYEIVFTTEDEQEAFDHERKLIAEIGLSNLTNYLTGGRTVREDCPARPIQLKAWGEETEAEYIAGLLSRWEMTDEQLRECVGNWRRATVEGLKQDYRAARRFNNDPELAAKLDPMITELTKKLMYDTPLDMPT